MTNRGRRRVLQITALPFPPEIRVVKEAISLVEAGYQSAVLCPPIKDRPERETWRGVAVFRPASLGQAATTADKLLYQTTCLSPAWLKAMRAVIAEYRPDVLHVHDIWLARTAFLGRTDQKVVLDLHENMPAAVVEQLKAFRGAQKWFNAVFRHHRRVARYERALLRKSDLVLVVVEEARRRVLDEIPDLPPEKVVNVENLETRTFVSHMPRAERVIADDHFSILYIGGFGPHRGIETLVRAMQFIKKDGLPVRLHLVGAQKGAYLGMVRQLIDALDVGSHVTVTGWVPAELVPAYITQASVCAVPHNSNPHTDNTIPHKLYQYMTAGRPVLVSTSAPLARTARAAGAGAIFRAGDAADCAEKIRQMASDPAGLMEAGDRGHRYVTEGRHNWEDEAAPVLVAAYDRLLGCTPEVQPA